MVCQVCQASCNPSLSSAYIIRTRLETATRVHRSGYPRLVRFYQRGKYRGRASRPSSDSHGRPHRRDRGQGRWRKRRHYGHRPDRCPASLTTSAGLTPGNGASTPCFSTRWNHSAPGCLERGDFGGSRAVRSDTMPVSNVLLLVNLSLNRSDEELDVISGMPPPSRTGITETSTVSTCRASSRLRKSDPPPKSQMSLPGFDRSSASARSGFSETMVTLG